jgi:hypothetical protein
VLTSHVLENDLANRPEALDGALSLFVHEARGMHVPNLSALLAQSMAQILFFRVEKKLLIESAYRPEQVCLNHHAGSQYRFDLACGQ